MNKGIIFSLEVLLVLLSSAALLYAMQPNTPDYSFAPWRAKLLAEDVAQVMAEKSVAEEIGEQELAEVLALTKEFGNYCVEVSYKSLKATSQGTSNCNAARNSVSSTRTIFDGSSFSQLAVKVGYE